MRTIEQLATEVRDEIGLFGPIEAKVLAVWLGLELLPMPYPCEGLIQNCRRSAAAYYAQAGETSVQQQIARAACMHMLIGAGIEFPVARQAELLAALLCGPELVPVAV